MIFSRMNNIIDNETGDHIFSRDFLIENTHNFSESAGNKLRNDLVINVY
jgi:hypothetical protein